MAMMMIAVVAVGLDGAEGSGEVSSAKRNGRANGGRSKVDRKVSSASGMTVTIIPGRQMAIQVACT